MYPFYLKYFKEKFDIIRNTCTGLYLSEKSASVRALVLAVVIDAGSGFAQIL